MPCAGMEAKLAEMLLDPETAPAMVKAHVESCDGCPQRAGRSCARRCHGDGRMGSARAESVFHDAI